MKLKILTLHWNQVDMLRRLHQTLIPSLSYFDYCWHIKDNGSKDGSEQFLKSIESDRIKTNFCGHNRDSFSAGMNILFNNINPDDNDLILILNNDIWFDDISSVDNMVSLLKNDVGVVGSRILYPNSNLLQHAGVYFSKKYNYIPYHFRHGERNDQESGSNHEVEAVTAACMLTKAEYFRKVCTTNPSGLNGFSEKYFWCFEDVDFNLSVKYNLGKKIMYCGKTKIFHEESASLKKNPVNKIMWQHNLKTFKDAWDGKFHKAD